MAEQRRRGSFGPTLLVGLAGATLAAVAGSRDWATASGEAAGVAVSAAAKGSSSAPLVVALALVALAAWGVVLVLRGQARRVVAVVGALASAGALAATVAGHGRAQADAVAAAMAKGGTGDAFSASLTAWYYTAGIGALLALAAFAVAVVHAPRWPAMGARYDAPTAAADAPAAGAAAGRPTDERDLWRALDEGHDPTA